jgi:hypothetical protein
MRARPGSPLAGVFIWGVPLAFPLKLNLSGDLAKYADQFRGDVEKQLRFAGAVALTKSAQAAQKSIVDAMPHLFDRPTPSTLNSLRVVPATKAKLEATVLVKDFTGKGPAPQDWLSAEILGGDRRHKRSENALIRAGVMQPDQFWTPGEGTEATLDAYGNVPSSMIVQAISRVSAFGEQGYRANAGDKLRRRLLRKKLVASKKTGTDYFIWRDKDGRAKAIMKLMGKGDVEPVLWFTDRVPDCPSTTWCSRRSRKPSVERWRRRSRWRD